MQKNGFNVFFILGPPGSGKGTQCQLLFKKLNFLHISAGELLRKELKSKSETADLIEFNMKNGSIVPSEITCRLLKKEMEINSNLYKHFLIDGFPRNFDNLSGWNSEMVNHAKVKGTILINCDRVILIDRISKRYHLEGRIDDSLPTLERRIIQYENETLKIISQISSYSPLLNINGNKPVIDVHNNIIKSIKYLI
jgi:UMP-CMP kinase